MTITSKIGWNTSRPDYFVQTQPYVSILRGGGWVPICSDSTFYESNDGKKDITGVPLNVSIALQGATTYWTVPTTPRYARIRSGTYRARWNGNGKFKHINAGGSSSMDVSAAAGTKSDGGATNYRDMVLTHPNPISAPYTPSLDLSLGWGADAHGAAVWAIRDLQIYHIDDEADYLAGKLFQKDWKKLLQGADVIRNMKMSNLEDRGIAFVGSVWASDLPGGRNFQPADWPQIDAAYYKVFEQGILKTVLGWAAYGTLLKEIGAKWAYICFPPLIDAGVVTDAITKILAVYPALVGAYLEVSNEIWNGGYKALPYLTQVGVDHVNSGSTPTLGTYIAYDQDSGAVVNDSNQRAYCVAADKLCAAYAEAVAVMGVGKVKMLIGNQNTFQLGAGHMAQWQYIDPRTSIRMKDHPHVGSATAPYPQLGAFPLAGAAGIAADPYRNDGDPFKAQWLTEQNAGAWTHDQTLSMWQKTIDALVSAMNDGTTRLATYANAAIFELAYEWGQDSFTQNYNFYPLGPESGPNVGYYFGANTTTHAMVYYNTSVTFFDGQTNTARGGAIYNATNAFSTGDQVWSHYDLAPITNGKRGTGSGPQNLTGGATGLRPLYCRVKAAGPPVELYLYESLADFNDTSIDANGNYILIQAGDFVLANYTRMTRFGDNMRAFNISEQGMRARHYLFTQCSQNRHRHICAFQECGNFDYRNQFGWQETQWEAISPAIKWAIAMNYVRN